MHITRSTRQQPYNCSIAQKGGKKKEGLLKIQNPRTPIVLFCLGRRKLRFSLSTLLKKKFSINIETTSLPPSSEPDFHEKAVYNKSLWKIKTAENLYKKQTKNSSPHKTTSILSKHALNKQKNSSLQQHSSQNLNSPAAVK